MKKWIFLLVIIILGGCGISKKIVRVDVDSYSTRRVMDLEKKYYLEELAANKNELQLATKDFTKKIESMLEIIVYLKK